MKKTIRISTLFVASGMLVFASCNDEKPGPIDNDYDFKNILTNVSENVITATYSDLHAKAEGLMDAVSVMQDEGTAESLDAARQAWRDCRRPWEQSEGFLFGPVETKGIDPSIDSWPVNTIDLDAVLASSDALTKEYIDGLEGTVKGFHTIEYLLFGTEGDKVIADFTAREFEYLISVSESLEGAIEELYDSWDPAEENFSKNVSEAGESGSIYVSQKAAMQEIVNGMIAIADEVANGKINDPFTQLDITLEESRFSANSKLDFQDNIRSIQNIYEGNYVTGTEGVSDFILETDGALDAEVHASIQNAIDMIGAIPGTFTEAIFANPTEVAAAQDAVRDLQSLMETKLKPVIDEL